MGAQGWQKRVDKLCGLGIVLRDVCLSGQRFITVCNVLQRIEQKMSQTATRRTMREKKPARQYWYDEPDYNNIAGSKTAELKDKPNNAPEVNNLARMLVRFIHSANQKFKDMGEAIPSDPHNHPQDHHPPHDHENNPSSRRPSGRGPKEAIDGGKPARNNLGDNSNAESRPSTKELKSRGLKPTKGYQPITAALETDLNYHNAINEHVKNTYPNINSISPDMLRELSIPTEILSKPPVPRPKKDEKKTGARVGKEENKPFKRQSYHVAIAYHIHLKQVKVFKTVEYVDPTFQARRLKQQESKKA